jgi:hypothetical protein
MTSINRDAKVLNAWMEDPKASELIRGLQLASSIGTAQVCTIYIYYKRDVTDCFARCLCRAACH